MSIARRPVIALLFVHALLGAGACKSLGLGARAPNLVQPLAAFDAIEISEGVAATITVGGDPSVAVEPAAGRGGQLEARVVNGTLVLSNRQSSSQSGAGAPASNKLHVRVVVPALRRLQVSGSEVQLDGPAAARLEIAARNASTVKIAGVRGVRLVLQASEGSRVAVAGTTNTLVADLSGGSRGDARELEVRTAKVHLDGACRLDLRPTRAITGEASGSSRLAVWSTPKRVKVATRGDSAVDYVR
jgi:hypothetical protein